MELDLDVSVENESYEQLLTSLGETIAALVRQQLIIIIIIIIQHLYSAIVSYAGCRGACGAS